MKQLPLFSGLIYLFLGILFTYFAIQDVQAGGWGIFPILLSIFATLDFGRGVKIVLFSILYKRNNM